jgi:hypothetical protein
VKARIGDRVVDLEGSVLGEILAKYPDDDVWVATEIGSAPERVELLP